MALVVKLVVGQFKLVKTNDLSHPCLPRSGRIRVDVDAWRHGRVSVSCHHPFGTVVDIPAEEEIKHRRETKIETKVQKFGSRLDTVWVNICAVTLQMEEVILPKG